MKRIIYILSIALLWACGKKSDSPEPTTTASNELLLYRDASGEQDMLVAANPLTGAKIWSKTFDYYIKTLVGCSTDGTLIVGTNKGMYGLDKSSGSQVWYMADYFYTNESNKQAVIVEGILVLNSKNNNTLSGIEAKTGKVVWSKNAASGHIFQRLSEYPNYVVETDLNSNPQFVLGRKLNMATGDNVWTKDKAWLYGTPDGVFARKGFDNKFYLIDPNTGTEKVLDGYFSEYQYTQTGIFRVGSKQIEGIDWKTGASKWLINKASNVNYLLSDNSILIQGVGTHTIYDSQKGTQRATMQSVGNWDDIKPVGANYYVRGGHKCTK